MGRGGGQGERECRERGGGRRERGVGERGRRVGTEHYIERVKGLHLEAFILS